jgi:hypothetical protein
MRTTRCGDLFLSAIAFAAAIIFWLPLWVWSLGREPIHPAAFLCYSPAGLGLAEGAG